MTRVHLVALLVVWILGGLYCWSFLDRGWVPYDDGGIAVSALAASEGGIPHRDFQEIYTGGTTYLHAAALRVFGVKLTSIRRALFLVFLIWLPAVYFIASRFAPPWLASLATLLAVTWSLPNYPAAVPSWYNLFLATLGAAALLRYLDAERRRWLVLAGAAGGLSCLAKTTGVFFLAGALLAMLYWEQTAGARTSDRERPIRQRSGVYTGALIVALVVLIGALVVLSRQTGGFGSVFHFVLPTASISLLVLANELKPPHRASAHRFATFAETLLPFLAGVFLVAGLFLVPYVVSGTFGDLVRSLALGVRNRVDFASQSPPAFSTVLTAVPVLALLVWGVRWPLRWRSHAAIALAAPLLWLLWSARAAFPYSMVLLSMRSLIPLTVVGGVLLLARRATADDGEATCRRRVMTLLSVAALCSLVQFPYAAPIYFFYTGSLGALALMAVLHLQQPGPRPIFAALMVFYMLFAALWINRGFIYWMGIKFVPNSQTELLDLDRGGIRVTNSDKSKYEAIVALVRAHSTNDYLLATPDCPEVYFLSGKRSPSGVIFEFLDPSEDSDRALDAALIAKEVGVVVLNRRPEFSGPPNTELLSRIERDYPESRVIDNFEVRWRR